MKEATIFETWAESLVEGTWAIPDNKEKQAKLVELMSAEFPVGPDATNATEQLYDLFGDDELFDQLEALAETDPDADCRQVVMDRMQMLSDDPDVRAVIDQIQIDPEATMNPAAPTDAAASAPPEQAPVPTMESISLNDIRRNAGLKILAENVTLDEDGSTLQHILNTFKRDVKDFEAGDEMSQELHDALYDYYFDDIPDGVKKARTGDPYEWVSDRFGADLGISGYGRNSPGIGPEDDPSLEREGVDYATEESLEDVTSIGGDSSDQLIADVMTNQQGADVNEEGLPEERLCNMTEAGESCPMHGVEECWANTPAMESAPDPVLERMREIAGLKKKVTDEGGEGSTAQVIKKILDPIAGAMGAAAGGGGKAILIQPIGEEETDEGSLSDVNWKDTLASTAGSLGGYIAGDAIGGPMVGFAGAGIGSAIGSALAKEDGVKEGSEETDEGKLGALGGGVLGMAATKSAKGAVAGAKLGSALQDRLEKTAEGKETPLQGQYGHPGKLEPVAENADFIARLKELSGMMRSDKI